MQTRSNSIVPCFHGGASYSFIGESFDRLDEIERVIDADVLDAWFPPSPRAIDLLKQRLPWSLRCSPPAQPTGVVQAISRAIEVSATNLVCGAGSSSLIFLALRELLTARSRVLLLDPTYGEYDHVLRTVIGCQVESFELQPEHQYVVDLQALTERLSSRRYDLLILVNPNNPSGKLIDREALEGALRVIPAETLVWIDEAYIDYAGAHQSVAEYAAKSSNVIVCKSLSKVLALSGLRVAYLCANATLIARLWKLTPPWSLSLPAQLVLIEALKDRAYYDLCYSRTRELREHLSEELRRCEFTPIDSVANFLLVNYRQSLPSADLLLPACSERRLLLRNVRSMGSTPPENCFRVAVKDARSNKKMIDVLQEVLATFDAQTTRHL